ncbi:zinc finger ranbp2-type [Desulfoluna spongiiphila]|nr:zinc finger ranbp2-type [Desulfoluna spongiiphila]
MSFSENGMKCPVCGYLNDPEDAECIACGSDMALSAESIAIEQRRSEEAMERYHLQQKELRRELGIDEPEEEPLVMAGGGEVPEPSEASAVSLEMESIPSDFHSDAFLCPQCGFRNDTEALECGRCGVIFSKLKRAGGNGNGAVAGPSSPAGRGVLLDDLGESALDTGTGYTPYVPETKPESWSGAKATGQRVKEAWEDVDLSGRGETALKGLQGVGARMKSVPPKWYGLALGIVLLLVALPFAWKGGLFLKTEWEQRSRLKLEATLVDEFTRNHAAIGAEIRSLADGKKFKEARAALDRFDIEPLQAKTEPLERYLEEKETYARVLAVPAWKFETNYTLFTRLVALDPSSSFYKSKQDFYKKRFAGQCYDKALRLYQGRKNDAAQSAKAVALIDKAVGFYPQDRTFKELRSKLIHADLLYYKGNGSLQMALRDEGRGKAIHAKQRKITIWLRNTSDATLYINPDFFTLETRNGKSLKYNNVMETGFQGKLTPGAKTAGVLYFRTLAMPRALTFEHLVAGTIQREFP